MSHFSKIKTTLKDLSLLQKSNGTEYQLVADLQFWQQPWSVELFLDKITQRYAYNSILKATEIQGFQRIEEITQENGSIKLTLQRWK